LRFNRSRQAASGLLSAAGVVDTHLLPLKIGIAAQPGLIGSDNLPPLLGADPAGANRLLGCFPKSDKEPFGVVLNIGEYLGHGIALLLADKLKLALPGCGW
jgi:hypothetical protein